MEQDRPNPRQKPLNHSISGSVLWQWRQDAIATCHNHAIPPVEVDWLLQSLTDLDRLALRLGYFQSQPTVASALPFDELQSWWQQRIDARLPIQYLVGQMEWRQFTMAVAPAVLIPRPETELIIDLAIAATTHDNLASGHWVDLGTGSGAIALGLADVFPTAQVHGVDCSAEALAIAQHNANMNGLGSDLSGSNLGTSPRDRAMNPIQWHQGSWFSPFEDHPIRFNGIVSNPPYIPSAMVLDLQPEVVNHEPHLALDGGKDGLDCLRHLIQTAPQYLAPHGVLLMEMMAGQADRVVSLLQQQSNYDRIEVHPDLAGMDRFVSAYRQ
ncbi:MAG: peptide chain release factor N(5)-glutamine methyltransferase [Merismopedia sp. SIO2A8]|nr:peptide chain release factor N(5)-glutamine methyltransferase [Merismopedia sp. SIO2A8]